MSVKDDILARYSRDGFIPDLTVLPEEDRPLIQDFLNVKRKKLKKTVEEMSEESGIPLSTVSRVLSTATSCNVHTMGPLARCVNFSLDAYYNIEGKDVSREIEKLELKLAHMEEQKKLIERDGRTKTFILFGVLICLLFAILDLIVPSIGLTAGSYVLAIILLVIISVYTGIVLRFMTR